MELFWCLCRDHKQKEVSKVLNKLKLDIVADQESWVKEGSVIEVQGNRIARGGREVLDF